MQNRSVFNEIFGEVVKLPVIDTHEHLLWSEETRVNDDTEALLKSFDRAL